MEAVQAIAITQRKEMTLAQQRLLERVRGAALHSADRELRWRPSSLKRRVYLIAHDVWVAVDSPANPIGGNVYWNPMGLVEGDQLPNGLRITVQVNPLINPAGRSSGGLFARDVGSGRLLLLHNGRVGGGAPGMGSTVFWERYASGPRVLVRVGEQQQYLAPVADLDSDRCTKDLAEFVRLVSRIKSESVTTDYVGPQFFPGLPKGDLPDPGKRKVLRRSASIVEANAWHADIVNGLRPRLSPDWEVRSDPAWDLALLEDGGLRAHIEVKTSADPQSVYTGVGQLMLRGSRAGAAHLVLLLPRDGEFLWRKALAEIGVETQAYEHDVDGRPEGIAALAAQITTLCRS